MATYSLLNKNKNLKAPPNTAMSLAQQVAKKQIPPTGQPPVAPPDSNPNAPPPGAQALKGGNDFSGQFKSRDNGPNARPQLSEAAKGLIEPQLGAQLKGTFRERENERARAENAAYDQASAAAAANAETNKQHSIQLAKEAAKKEMTDKAANNKRELADKIDYDGDGMIGGEEMYGGHKPSQEELINTQINKLLQGGASPEEIDKERQAMKGELKSAEARDIQSTRARTGLGGMGLTGAAGAMESQVRQESARKEALTMADFERQQRSEAAQRALQGMEARRGEQVFRTESQMYEEEEGKDLDGDGLVGNTPVAEWNTKENQQKNYDRFYAEAQANTASAVRTGNTVNVSNEESGTGQNGQYKKAAGNSTKNIPKPYEDLGFVMVGDRVVHLFKGPGDKRYYTEPNKPE